MRAIGIEVSSSAIRFIELEKQTEGIKLVGALSVPTTAFDLDNENVDAAIEEADELLGKYAQAGLNFNRGVVGLTGREIMLRYMKIPDVPEAQQRAMIQLELDALIGEDAENIVHDHIALPIQDGGTDSTMLVAMTKNEFLETTLGRLAKLHVKPTRLTPSSVALFNAYQMAGEFHEGETILVAAIGCTETEMCIVRDGSLVFARNINSGGLAMAEALAESKGMPPAKAWRMLLAKGDLTPGRGDGGLLQAKLNGAADVLFRGLESSVNFAKLQLRMLRLSVDRVVITGEIARLKGIREFMQKNFKKPVDLLDPFANCEAGKLPEASKRGENDPTKLPHQYAVAAGLAKIGLDADAFAVKLEPNSVGSFREFVHRSLFLYGAVFVALLMIALSVVSANDFAGTASVAKRDAEAKKVRVDGQVKDFEKAQQAYAATEPSFRAARAALLPSYDFLKIMSAIRQFGDEHEELIVESVKFSPPRDKDLKASHTLVLVLYFTDKAPDDVQPYIEQLTRAIRTACPDSIRPDGIVPTEDGLPADSPLKTGEKYILQITLAQP